MTKNVKVAFRFGKLLSSVTVTIDDSKGHFVQFVIQGDEISIASSKHTGARMWAILKL